MISLSTLVLAAFVGALLSPFIHRMMRNVSGWVIALIPAAVFAALATYVPAVATGTTITVSHTWVASLGANLSFMLDGLSLLFALIISFVGILVVVYAGGYLHGHEYLGRFYLYILAFMGSMLGLVLSDSMISMFVFWELTSVTSYLLIGFDSDRVEARAAALKALLITAGGGLALLAGFVLLAQAGGSFELSDILGKGEYIRDHWLYTPMLLLILLGAFTKSAQFPFHFWLPGAMEAPTPVSAYLHSATMVKAGIFLLARLNPVLGGTDEWYYIVGGTGCFTMLLGGYVALQKTDLKQILAYSTVSALGILTMLIGLGTSLTITAAMLFLLVHSLYKGALFLVAGALDHETGTRDIRFLGGLRKAMPVTAFAAIAAGLSMAGLPPFIGFIGKELIYESTLHHTSHVGLLTVLTVAGNILVVVVGLLAGVAPFIGARRETPKNAHEAPWSLLLGPVVLASLGLVAGIFPALAGSYLTQPAAVVSLGAPAPYSFALWHGLTPMLVLSAVTVIAGVGVFAAANSIRPRLQAISLFSPEQRRNWYDIGLAFLATTAKFQTQVLQSGYLRVYLLIILVATVGIVGFTLLEHAEVVLPASLPDVTIYDVLITGLIVAAVVSIIRSTSRLAAVASLGVVGFSVALIFILFGAPDLAMTQFAIETLTVILFVLVIYKLPPFLNLSSRRNRARDLTVAALVGSLFAALVFTVTSVPLTSALKTYFAESSYPLAKGRNVVNVILVDFRAIDTMGEITVLAIAAIGAFALLKLSLKEDGER
jgi:multicomponent Na+:H+ antiporter subunit A